MTISTIENVSAATSSVKNAHVVIVGAGFAGISAAKALKNAPVQVTVVDRQNHHLFQPLLYQVATAVLSPADISAPVRHILRKQKNVQVMLAEVTGIDRENQLVLAGENQIPYDYLILATGATHSYFGNDQWAAYAPGLKSIADATALRRRILLAFEQAEVEADPDKQRALLTFVLIGGGPTGVEMAGAIAELAHVALASDFRNIDPRSTRIILVEALPRILPIFEENLAKHAQAALNHLGVEVRTGVPVKDVTAEGVLIGDAFVAARTVIWTAGVAASPAGSWLGGEVDRAGRVKVQPDLTFPGDPKIFIVGDTASVFQDGKPVPGVAPAAMQEGKYAAVAILCNLQDQMLEPFRYHNKGNMATIGRSYGIADIGRFKITGFLGWLLWLFVHIAFLVGFRNRFFVAFQSFWGYVTSQRGARLITVDAKHAVKAKDEARSFI